MVLIMLGTNDTKPQNWVHKTEYAKDYKEMIQQFQALPTKPKIFICRPCPVPGAGNWGINEAGVKEAIPMIDALAAETKSEIIDMHAALNDFPETLPDRVHPNDAGAAKMAEAAFKAITAAKKRPISSQRGPLSLKGTPRWLLLFPRGGIKGCMANSQPWKGCRKMGITHYWQGVKLWISYQRGWITGLA
jgi:GDSL-like Lipase/Acylhydrolase family